MRTLLVLAALCMSAAAHAQPARDANPRADQNTQGANTDGGAMDPATKSRVRTEGSAGGVQGGLKTDEQKKGASAGSSPGRPMRQGKTEKPEGGRVHNETSSDREEGRGARGAIR
jgi:hypothetical protein